MLANLIRSRIKTGVSGGGGGIVIDGGDPYYSAVSLMLSMDGTNGSTTFTDSSLNALTVTASGNAQISTTQSKYGGASGYFDGTGDYLSIAANAAINLSSSDFTIEFWIRPAPKTNAVDAAFGYGNYGCMFYHNGTNWTLEMSSTGTSNQLVISCAVTLNTWQHIAIVRYGTSIVVYKDGVSSATGTFSGALATSGRTLRIGDNGNSQNINGYIDDFRISLFARYVSNFTPPTAALPTSQSSTVADPYYNYTSLLLHMDGTNTSTSFVDSGPNALAVTAVGNAQVSTAQSKYGGASGYFDGSGDAVQIPYSAALDLTSGDFTIEGWVYFNSVSGTPTIITPFGTGNTFGGWVIVLNSSSQFAFYLSTAANTWNGPSNVLFSATAAATGTWYHFALVRNGSTFTPYLNGIAGTTATFSSTLYNNSKPLKIGAEKDSNVFPLNGYIDDFRITKGARYTAAFTPPAAALPEFATGNDRYFSNVSLLLHMDGANGSTTFTDNSSNARAITAVGNAQISTTQSQFGGASGYFDGTGDYLSIAANAAIDLSSSDFTIEFWIRPAPKTNAVDSAFGYGNYGCMFYHNGTNWTLEMSSTGTSNQLVISCAVTLNTWQHIAIVRGGSSIVVYKDGVSSATGTFSGTVATSGRTLRIGDNGNSQNINGYIDDFRITKGVARTITVPTAPYPNA